MSKTAFPWFPFYTGDWRSNIKLGRCSFAQKGLWIDTLCILHESAEYGVCRWPLAELAAVLHCKLPELKSLVRLDILRGVESGLCTPEIFVPTHSRKKGGSITIIPVQEGPIWYSSRMVLDDYKQRVQRKARANKDAPDLAPEHAPRYDLGAAPEHAPRYDLGLHPLRARSDSDSETGFDLTSNSREREIYPRKVEGGMAK